MRRDLIIGLIVSALLHGAVFGSSFLKAKPKPQPPPPAEPTIVLMQMPKLEPPPDQVIEEKHDTQEQKMEFVPPMQTDVPQIVKVNDFVQKIQPPPPEGLKPNPNALTIPPSRTAGLGNGVHIFDLKDLDRDPQPKVQVRPQYPFEMRREGVSGQVVVEFIVDNQGFVHNAYAVSSSSREFEAPAVQAVSKWTFIPGRKGGMAVAVRMRVPIIFNLNDQ